MATKRKLGKPTDQRLALVRNQVTELLWNGRIQTTYARAKEVSREAEKLLTLAVKTYRDTVNKVETRLDKDKKEYKVELVNDGPKKLAARRKIMSFVYSLKEQRKPKETPSSFRARTQHIKHPLIEKIFNEYAPKYDQRAQEVGQGGGYTRVLKLGPRHGDAAELAIIELV